MQLGAFPKRANAEQEQGRARNEGLPAVIVSSREVTGLPPNLFVVFYGAFPTTAAAKTGLREAKQAGFKDAFIRASAP